MRFVEENEAAWSAEQLAAAEAQIEQQKREWELGRLQALKAEEERRLQEEELDEDLLTYSREDSTNQVNEFKNKKSKARRKKSQCSESEDESNETDTSIDTLTEEDDDEDDDNNDDDDDEDNLDENDSDFETSHKTCRNSVKNDSSCNSTENVVNNSSRKTRSRGSVDINLWTLDENPILPGVKPVRNSNHSKETKLLKRPMVKLTKINGEATEMKSKQRRILSTPRSRIGKGGKNRWKISQNDLNDVDVISCNNESNFPKPKIRIKKYDGNNERNGPIPPTQIL